MQLNDLGWESIGPLLRRKVVDGSNMTLTRYSFAPGGRFPHHAHNQEQITYVLRGGITFSVGEDEYPLGEGEVIVIQSDSAHSAVASEDGAEVLSVVSPARGEGSGIQLLEDV